MKMRLHYLICFTAILLLSSFSEQTKKGPRLPKEFTQIPAGVLRIDSVTHFNIETFFISKYEVSNKQYRQFYNEISKDLTGNEKAGIAIDSTGWKKLMDHVAVQAYYHSARFQVMVSIL